MQGITDVGGIHARRSRPVPPVPGLRLAIAAIFVAFADRWRRARIGKTAAARARETADELGLLIDGAAGYAIYMLDPAGRVTIWNKGAERLKG